MANLKTSLSRKQSLSPDPLSNFPKNEHFLPPGKHTYLCVSGGKKCSFFGKYGVLCFLETPLLRFLPAVGILFSKKYRMSVIFPYIYFL